MAGADPVILIEPNASRAAAAHALVPFAALVVPGKQDLASEVKRLTGGAGADVLVTSWMYFAPPADIQAEIAVWNRT